MNVFAALAERHPILADPAVQQAFADRLEADVIRMERIVEDRMAAMKESMTIQALIDVFGGDIEPITANLAGRPNNVIDLIQPEAEPEPGPEERTLRWTKRRQKLAAKAFASAKLKGLTGMDRTIAALIGTAQTTQPSEAQEAMVAAADLIRSSSRKLDSSLLAVVEAWGGDFRVAAQANRQIHNRRSARLG